ncbi:MAG: ATPase, partial [Eubacteriales bacterium]
MAIKIITAILVLSILVPFAVYFMGEKTYKKGKRCMLTNIATFFTTLAASTFMMFSGTVFAE